MERTNHIAIMNELSASEGVFTAAQAKRLGVTDNALSKAVSSGRAERVLHGAYRLAGAQSRMSDELAAVWKLTCPARFTGERAAEWDGIAVGGTTAAALLGIGDFHLSPYRVFAPRRINSRIGSAWFGKRAIDRRDIRWIEGLPVTSRERTIVDLCLDAEDASLISDAFDDAAAAGLDPARMNALIEENERDLKKAGTLELINQLADRGSARRWGTRRQRPLRWR